MLNTVLLGGGLVLFAVFLSLYFYYREKGDILPKVFSVLSVIGLAVLIIGAIRQFRPMMITALPNATDYIIIGIVVVAALLAFWFLLRPAFSSKKKEKVEEVKRITATGTKTVSGAATTKKKKKKNNSMKAQMGTSKKRRLPRY